MYINLNLVLFIVIGGIAGWIAGVLTKGSGFGLIGNIIVGIIGAVIGGWLFSYLGIRIVGGLLEVLIVSTIGAIVLLFGLALIRKI